MSSLHPPSLLDRSTDSESQVRGVVYEQPLCRRQTVLTPRANQFILFVFKVQIPNNSVLSSSFTDLTPAVLVFSAGNSHCAHRTREVEVLPEFSVSSLAISFLYGFGGKGFSFLVLRDFNFW